MRCTALIISVIAACVAGAAAHAQQSPRIDPDALRAAQQQIAAPRFQLPQRLQAEPGQASPPDFETGSGYQLNPDNDLWYGWVNFDQDRTEGLVQGEAVNLGWRKQAGGVRFATGQREPARIVRCGTGSNICALPQADSPDALIAGAGAGRLRIDFAQPVVAVTLLAAPDRSVRQAAAAFVLEGWRDGDIASVTRQDVQIYDSPGAGWTRLTLSGLAGAARAPSAATTAATPTAGAADGQEFDYVVIRAVNANGGPVTTPIVVDSLRFADRYGPTPYDSLGPRTGDLQDMLDASARTSAQLERRAQIVEPGGPREDLRYPVAERRRMPIDRAGARAAAIAQREALGIELSLNAGLRGQEPVTLPILAPLGIFQDEDPSAGVAEDVGFTGRGDYFHLRFSSDIGRVVISGTRIVTPRQAGTLSPGELEASAGYDGAYASFALFGAAYSVRVACGTEEIDEPCNDPEALRTLLDRLILWTPEA